LPINITAFQWNVSSFTLKINETRKLDDEPGKTRLALQTRFFSVEIGIQKEKPLSLRATKTFSGKWNPLLHRNWKSDFVRIQWMKNS
jgi:hypothetical protein